jgi:GTP cyclohydrolase I
MFNEDKIKKGVRMILEGIGENPDRAGLLETPDRVARMYKEVFSSINLTDDVLECKTFEVETPNMVMVNDIPFYSMCEHHILPFFGHASIAYLPKNRVIGLSKLGRIVEFHARKTQLQEQLTEQIAETVSKKVENNGVLVFIKAEHLCVSMRGVKKPGTSTITIAKTGEFATNKDLCDEALSFLRSTS